MDSKFDKLISEIHDQYNSNKLAKEDIDEIEDTEDGWSEDIKEQLSDIMQTMDSFMYEIRNCVKGSYTNAHTTEQLAEYIHNLAEQLENISNNIR